jgi:hypothetical protein
MNIVHVILDGARLVHTLPILKIVETGTKDTIDIATWCSKNSASSFVNVDIDGLKQDADHKILEGLNADSALKTISSS